MIRKLMLVLATTLIFATAVFAQVEVGTAMKIHQDCDIKVNDLHFRVHPKEPWIYIMDWKMNIYGSPGYTYTVDSFYNSDCKLHWLVFNVTFDDPIPYCESIELEVILWLDSWNSIIIDDLYWTLDGEPVGGAFTERGFSVDFIRSNALTSAAGYSTYWLHNESGKTLLVKDFKYARNQKEALPPIKILEGFQEWTDYVGDFEVPPGKSFAIPLEKIEPELFLYVGYELYEIGTSLYSEEFLGPVADLHEDQTEPGKSIGIKEQGLLDEVKFLDVSADFDKTSIRYQLPKATHVNLSVYSVAGERVATLVDELQPAGGHTLVWDGDDLPAGLYIARISADGIEAAEKMVRLK